MNELAGYTRPKASVTRPVFVKFFLQVLRETSNLTVSFEEADNIFDEISCSTDANKVDEVHMSTFYHSSMANFLSDVQICEIIKRFKTIKMMSGGAARSEKARGRQSIFSFGSISGALGMSTSQDGCLGGSPTSRISVFPRHVSSVLRRRSGMSAGSTDIGPSRDSLMVIARAEFVEHYPQLLIEVTMDHEASAGRVLDDEWKENLEELVYPGIDITFQNLSLAIKVGDSSINVVDNVTGSIRAKTMTALMGKLQTGG